MSGEMERAIREVLGSEGRGIVERAAADILRALLLLYGSAWESDLMDTLTCLWGIRGMSLEEMGEATSALPAAEKLLAERGLIRVETRYKADLGKSEASLEKFISTDYLYALMRMFSGDPDLNKLRFQMQQG